GLGPNGYKEPRPVRRLCLVDMSNIRQSENILGVDLQLFRVLLSDAIQLAHLRMRRLVRFQ
ncbi:MAG: hypothetical protein ACRD3Y_08845, partial [Bryobacteraceae bacterium]